MGDPFILSHKKCLYETILQSVLRYNSIQAINYIKIPFKFPLLPLRLPKSHLYLITPSPFNQQKTPAKR